MTEPVRIGDATLYCGDCREILPTIGRVDAVVTDPPYGIKKAEWDEAFPEDDLRNFTEIARSVCIMPGLWAMPACIHLLGERYKSVLAGINTNGMTFGPIGFNNWIPAVCAGDVPRKGQDAFSFSVGADTKPDHPSPKPLSFMLRLIDRVTEHDWLVCDPYLGSGTTGVACAKLGRRFIGCEIEPKYFDIACRRIEEAYAQPRLFEEPRPRAQQETLAL